MDIRKGKSNKKKKKNNKKLRSISSCFYSFIFIELKKLNLIVHTIEYLLN